jgi:pimeloyl-ACP methyl ester carboxylesterase
MRSVLTTVVNEDLTDAASTVRCPTMLVYGAQDDDTPPEMGSRFQKLIPNSEFVVLDGFDHTSIVQQGRHQVVHLINRFMGGLAQ